MTSSPAQAVNLADYEALARERLDPGALGYVAGGAADEITLQENRTAFERLRLLPRVLVDVSTVDLSSTILGQPVAFPILVAPTAFQSLAHPEGELATARAAAAAGALMIVSTMASFPLEEVAAVARAPRWFQLYCYRDRGVTRRLVERAEAAGYGAICLTVDLPRVGRRERDLRSGFALPQDVRPRNFDDLVTVTQRSAAGFSSYINHLVDPSLTWEAVDWLVSITRLPVVVKGILAPADARLAAEHGARAIVVSNHGARQLDTVPATIAVLEDVVAAVGGRAEVLLDGGVRRGTDVVKALALGAKAVCIGRPCFYGLVVEGEAGVRKVLAILRDELEIAMALIGAPRVREVSRAHVA